MAEKTRRDDLDAARAFAAFAVVLLHVTQYFARHGLKHLHPWFANVEQATNFLHIPTFMLVAGMVLALYGRPVRNVGEYLRFEWKKVLRLMLPFVSVSLMTLAVKVLAPGYEVSDTRQKFVNMVLAPRAALAPHLWFLYCLMSVFILWPLVRRLATARTAGVLLAALVVVAILPIPWPEVQRADAALAGDAGAGQAALAESLRSREGADGRPMFGLADVAWYLPIFALGYLYGDRLMKWRGRGAVTLAAFVAVAAAIAVHLKVEWPGGAGWETAARAVRFAGYVAGGLFIVGLSGAICAHAQAFGRFLARVGAYTYDVYLLHVALVAHPLVYALAKVRPGPVDTYVLYILATPATMAIAMAIGWVIRGVPPAGFVMLGVPWRRRARRTQPGEPADL